MPRIKNSKLGLVTGPSTIPNGGTGLFAYRDIPKDKVIIEYKGEIISKRELDRRYPNETDARYVLKLGKDKYIDASDTSKSNMARYANHKPKKSANAIFTTRGNIKSIKPIKAGQEIFLYYGRGFNF
jgi:SET domain-containing protein